MNKLSRLGAADLSSRLEAALSLPLVEDKTELGDLVQVIARRNLLTHQSGVVDERYLGEFPQAPYRVGDRLVFHTYETVKDYVFLHDVAVDFDARVLARFPLPTTSP